jgi:hypothetical protein
MTPSSPFFIPLLFITMLCGVFMIAWLWDVFTKH